MKPLGASSASPNAENGRPAQADTTGPSRPLIPYRESLWATVRRTSLIAVFLATALMFFLDVQGNIVRFWLITFAAVLWFPLGGHLVELAYLNGLRMRWAWVWQYRYGTRVVWWALCGLPVGLGCWWTWLMLGSEPDFELPFWWGVPFYPLTEFVVHTILSATGRPSFWNGCE